ncbi:MAG: cell division protein ZipA [Pasteurellaceae bacterium]|nr:cell division protein ZipA [Pasteurellaceae bacterium]
MDNHIFFFIIAGVLIAILIGFSLWSARREKSRVFSNTFSTRPPATPITHNEVNMQIPPAFTTQETAAQPSFPQEPVDLAERQQQEIEQGVKNIQIRLAEEPKKPTTSSTVESFTTLVPVPELEPQPAPVEPIAASEQAPTMITLYVVAAEGQQFQGEQIAQQLDTLGFVFGEYQIFHRHLNDSNSPVLFSVANMMQPGIFDLNTLDQFQTVGLVFFMQLPSIGSDIANLRLMIRSVESFAHAMNGFVLNDQQQLFDDQSRQDYLLRVSQS